MMRTLLLLLNIIIAISAAAQADSLTLQQLKDLVRENPALAGGNHLNYPVGAYSPAPAPKGYEPVVISHYGRHGSRYATKSEKYDHVEALLRTGHDLSRLTEAGEDLYERYMKIYPLLKGHDGDLTVKGQEQHRGIADRMVAAYPKVFKKNVKVDARSTTVPRAIISMMSFCDELRQLRPGASVSYGADTPDLVYTALADPMFFEDSGSLWGVLQSAFKNPAVGKTYYRLQKEAGKVAEDFFLRYFSDIETVKSVGKPTELFADLGEVLTSMQCVDFEADFSDIFTQDETFSVWERGNLFSALMFAGTPYTDSVIPGFAHTLLEQIMASADKDLAGEGVQVRLRFGHDTVVGPLAALMGLHGFGKLGANPDYWLYHFQSWNIPMASNIQFIFYRNKKVPNDVLVRVMYNEKDQTLPLTDQSLAPYYKWDDFKAYYKPVCEQALSKLAEYTGRPVVKTDGGRLIGEKLKDDVLVYKGVPFAAPPVGELRDKPLQPVQPWEGVKVADRFPAAAMQTPIDHNDPLYYREFYAEGDPVYSDDCMYLNIWAPAKSEKAPVAVWIHGGAFSHGYSFEKEMDGEAWARKGVILVTIPYRLGELGFGTPDMLGFQDQLFALRWVHDNIAAFGGDPDNVTILGQSAGAISVKYLLSNPEAQPLFAKAIIQSGGGLNVMDVPPILPVGTRGEIFAEALEKGAFDAKPIMIGYTANDPGFLGKPTTLEFCEKVSARGNGQVYTYEFRRDPPGEAEGEINWGAFHTVELWYTFGTLSRCWRPFTEADYELSARMIDAWTSFAKTGNPGWESATTDNLNVKVFDIE